MTVFVDGTGSNSPVPHILECRPPKRRVPTRQRQCSRKTQPAYRAHRFSPLVSIGAKVHHFRYPLALTAVGGKSRQRFAGGLLAWVLGKRHFVKQPLSMIPSMAGSRTTASCASSFHDISDDEDCSSIHSSDYSQSTASNEHGIGAVVVNESDHDDGVIDDEEEDLQEDHESTAVEDLDEYVSMKQKGTLQSAGAADTEQRQQQTTMSEDDEDDSSASHWESETSSNISSGADEDDDVDGDNQTNTSTVHDCDRERYEEARARMLVQKHSRQPKQVQLLLQPNSNLDENYARRLSIQQQQRESEVERLRKIRQAEEARIRRFAQKQQEDAEFLKQQQKQQLRIQKEEARRKQALLQHFLEDEKRTRKQKQQDEKDAGTQKNSEQKLREEEARLRARALRRQHICNEESRQNILPSKSCGHASSNVTQQKQQRLFQHQRHFLKDDLSVNTGQSPTKPIVLSETSTTMISPHPSPTPRPCHIDLTRAPNEERYSPTPHRPVYSPDKTQLPVPQSILQQIKQMQLQRQRQEEMDQERLQTEIERQSRLAQKNKVLREKYALSSSPPLSPKPDRRRYDYDYHPELEAEKMRVLTIEPRKFPASDRAVEHHKQRMHHSSAPPLVAPAMFASDEDISTTGGTIRLFNKMMMQHQHRHAAPYSHPHRDVERGAALTKSAPIKGSDERYSCICGWLSSRTELEIFFVFVIVVTMMTLVVLFTLILIGKA